MAQRPLAGSSANTNRNFTRSIITTIKNLNIMSGPQVVFLTITKSLLRTYVIDVQEVGAGIWKDIPISERVVSNSIDTYLLYLP